MREYYVDDRSGDVFRLNRSNYVKLLANIAAGRDAFAGGIAASPVVVVSLAVLTAEQAEQRLGRLVAERWKAKP